MSGIRKPWLQDLRVLFLQRTFLFFFFVKKVIVDRKPIVVDNPARNSSCEEEGVVKMLASAVA